MFFSQKLNKLYIKIIIKSINTKFMALDNTKSAFIVQIS